LRGVDEDSLLLELLLVQIRDDAAIVGNVVGFCVNHCCVRVCIVFVGGALVTSSAPQEWQA
jgi:hypothetical protein